MTPAAQLHLLQCVQFAPDTAQDLAVAVDRLLQARKTLVKVWAMDAFVRIADLRSE